MVDKITGALAQSKTVAPNCAKSHYILPAVRLQLERKIQLRIFLIKQLKLLIVINTSLEFTFLIF